MICSYIHVTHFDHSHSSIILSQPLFLLKNNLNLPLGNAYIYISYFYYFYPLLPLSISPKYSLPHLPLNFKSSSYLKKKQLFFLLSTQLFVTLWNWCLVITSASQLIFGIIIKDLRMVCCFKASVFVGEQGQGLPVVRSSWQHF